MKLYFIIEINLSNGQLAEGLALVNNRAKEDNYTHTDIESIRQLTNGAEGGLLPAGISEREREFMRKLEARPRFSHVGPSNRRDINVLAGE
jgi:hypothetical protein